MGESVKVITVIMTCLMNIAYCAFAGCDGITTLTLPEGITSIGEEAFACEYVKVIMAIMISLKNITYSAFAGCGITSVTLPDSLTHMGQGAFDSKVQLGPPTHHLLVLVDNSEDETDSEEETDELFFTLD